MQLGCLPDSVGMEVLAIGRDMQPFTRLAPDGRSFRVHTLQILDSSGCQPFVSGLQAELSYSGEALLFISVGRSFNFVNEVPVHAKGKRVPTRMRVYDGDIIRLGGDLSGRADGDYTAFVFRVDHSPLGRRPALAASVHSLPGSAPTAASISSRPVRPATPLPMAAPVPAATPPVQPAALLATAAGDECCTLAAAAPNSSIGSRHKRAVLSEANAFSLAGCAAPANLSPKRTKNDPVLTAADAEDLAKRLDAPLQHQKHQAGVKLLPADEPVVQRYERVRKSLRHVDPTLLGLRLLDEPSLLSECEASRVLSFCEEIDWEPRLGGSGRPLAGTQQKSFGVATDATT